MKKIILASLVALFSINAYAQETFFSVTYASTEGLRMELSCKQDSVFLERVELGQTINFPYEDIRRKCGPTDNSTVNINQIYTLKDGQEFKKGLGAMNVYHAIRQITSANSYNGYSVIISGVNRSTVVVRKNG